MMRILVADDDPVYRMLMAHGLSRWGYEVESVCDGGSALASLASQHGPCLAILDWRMPVLDGIEVCRRVRAESEGQYVYLLLVTACDAPADRLAGMDAGADDYLTKPVDMAELRMRIRAGCRILEFGERSRQLFENAPIAYHEADTAGVIVRVNQAECKLLGYSAGELLGRHVWDFVRPAQVEKRMSAFMAAIKTGDGPIEDSEWELCARDGNPLLVRLQQNRISDSFGRVAGLRCTMLDVTELRRQEEILKSQAADLKRSNAELEQFAYVASHDLQEPLRMIASFAQLLSRRYAGRLDSRADEYIGFVVDGAKRMQQLISDLLSLSRVGTRGGEFKEIDLEGVLSEVLLNLGPAIHDEGAVVTHERLPSVVGDRGQMAQLFQNLIGNSMKFHGAEPPRVHISAAETGQEWTTSVSDNGIGIAPAYSDRVFQIFQRLHSREQYPGTGIGLAVCKKIVERHGGRIWFDSVPGAGTTFRFTIPSRGQRGLKQEGMDYERRT
jgi:PAS domain S-box-containing protein